MVNYKALRDGLEARLLAAGNDQEQRAKVLRAITDARMAVDRSDIRGMDYMNAKGDAYRDVIGLLILIVQTAERGDDIVRDETWGYAHNSDPVYEAEVAQLWAIVERVVAEHLD